jgi:cold shock protein
VISPTNTTKHTGTIRWYNVAKGVGFIAPNVPGPNLFLHRTSLTAGYTELEPGESVRYHPMPVARNERAMMAHEKMTIAVEHGAFTLSLVSGCFLLPESLNLTGAYAVHSGRRGASEQKPCHVWRGQL